MNTSRIDHESEATTTGPKAARWTPGPWPIWSGERAGFTHIAIGHIASMRPAYVETQSPDAEVMKANAKLIAAAPDLFAVLSAIVDEIDRRGLCMNDAPRLCAVDEGLIAQAMAALEKAGGAA